MGSFAAGQVVLVDFPFSDLTSSKVRPAVVLAEAGKGDWLLCQITSKTYADGNAIQIADPDVLNGSLHQTSFARPGKLFTAHASLINRVIGALADVKFAAIRAAVVQIVQTGKA
jgi:mRNA interferase MazF